MKKGIDGAVVEMVPIGSKNLSCVGYDAEKRQLTVEFTRGPVYLYYDVPKALFEALLVSDTPDDYFNEKLRYGYKNKRVW
jgi:hypothetical protein